MSRKLQYYQNQKYSNWNIDLKESRLEKVKELILKLKTGVILDVGCNGGEFSSLFKANGWKVYGIEISSEKVKLAKKKGIIAFVGNIEKKFPYKNNYFDVIFAGEIIEHVYDTTFVLHEFQRILKKGGKLILTTPNLASLENRLRILFGMQPLWVDFKSEKSSGHIRAYTYAALEEQLNEVGFRVEKFWGNFVPFWQLRWNDINLPWLKYTGYWFPSFSQGLIIQASK